MSSSSSSDSKPLNPSALCYEPRFMQTLAKSHYPLDKIYLPHQFPLQWNQYEAPLLVPHPQVPVGLPDFCLGPSFAYYSPWCWDNKEELYDSEKQPHPRIKVLNTPNSVPYDGVRYGSGRIVGHKKKGRCGPVPPRLKAQRESPVLTRVWVPRKADAEKIQASWDVHGGDPVPAEEQMKFDGKTSIMIKNVPNHLTRSDLQHMLDRHCRTENQKAQAVSNFCKSAYDFLYLPMDFGFHLNLGFAFVNFTSPVAASRFSSAFHRREWSSGDRSKTCEICFAKLQGKDALRQQFRKSSFPCHSDEYLPVVYSPPRDGFIRSRPKMVGRRTHFSTTSNGERVMIMFQRKNRKP